jgi:hypothetical protein
MRRAEDLSCLAVQRHTAKEQRQVWVENLGSIFVLVPPAAPGGAWTNTTLHSFTAKGGSLPVEGLLPSNGVLYGTTQQNARVGCGTVFLLLERCRRKALRLGGGRSGYRNHLPQFEAHKLHGL